DWLEFNLSLSDRVLTGDRKAIAIDPSYITKSGKNTPWIGYFWSGAAGQAKRGLEILGVGLIDVDNKDCISLQAVQTPDRQTLESRDANLIDWYLLVIKSMREKLHRASRHVVADAYFAKNNFVTGLQEMKFDLVSPSGMTPHFIIQHCRNRQARKAGLNSTTERLTWPTWIQPECKRSILITVISTPW